MHLSADLTPWERQLLPELPNNAVERSMLLSQASALPSISDMLEQAYDNGDLLLARIEVLKDELTSQDFWKEQQDFDQHCRKWEQYVSIFEKTHHRAPVMYDLCCGEGGISRGARTSGVRCYGFDT